MFCLSQNLSYSFLKVHFQQKMSESFLYLVPHPKPHPADRWGRLKRGKSLLFSIQSRFDLKKGLVVYFSLAESHLYQTDFDLKERSIKKKMC